MLRLPYLSLVALFVGVACAVSGSIEGLVVLRPAIFFVGGYMLALSVAMYCIHLVFVLLREHEMWKRNLENRAAPPIG